MRLIPILLIAFSFFSSAENLSNQDMETIRALQRKAEQDRIDKDLKDPIKPEISKDRAVEGSATAPITIVAYSDFQCPYCSKGAETVRELKKKYKTRMRFMFKHFPLGFHPLAMPGAKRFEALALQSTKLAYAFHDEVFANQAKLKDGGEAFLDEVAKKVGGNMTKLKKDLDSEKVTSRISADMGEGQKIGVQGTPAFVVQGVRLFGAYPKEMFELIIEKSLEKKK